MVLAQRRVKENVLILVFLKRPAIQSGACKQTHKTGILNILSSPFRHMMEAVTEEELKTPL